jgi:hypothetical protein
MLESMERRQSMGKTSLGSAFENAPEGNKNGASSEFLSTLIYYTILLSIIFMPRIYYEYKS